MLPLESTPVCRQITSPADPPGTKLPMSEFCQIPQYTYLRKGKDIVIIIYHLNGRPYYKQRTRVLEEVKFKPLTSKHHSYAPIRLEIFDKQQLSKD